MRSFDLVDFKVSEADFFLERLQEEAVDFATARFYFSAYTAAARSITFCLQAVLNHLSGFKEWYDNKKKGLMNDPLARFFIEARNMAQKVGVVPICMGIPERTGKGKLRMRFYFERDHPDFKIMPEAELVASSTVYLKHLIKIVYDCYIDFGTAIDPHQHYTRANFMRMGRNIDDADEELMGIRGWTAVDDWPESYRWQILRKQLPGCRIEYLFHKYLNLKKPAPPSLPEDPTDFDGIEWVPPCLRSNT